VLIPAANVDDLMLRRDVVAAAVAGQFHVYPVNTVDEGIALLTGLAAGALDETGHYPPESLNGLIVARLKKLADTQRDYNRPSPSDKEDADADPAEAGGPDKIDDADELNEIVEMRESVADTAEEEE
jgi:hypothetical protein